MKRIISILLMMVICLTTVEGANRAFAEEGIYFIICTPQSEINVRRHAKRKSELVAVVDFGTQVLTDGKERNGFAHIVDLPAEVSSGWVSTGYLVEDRPIECKWIGYAVGLGKILARKCINGKVVKRIEPGSEVMIYAYSETWCVTEYGYIRTEFLEVPQQED